MERKKVLCILGFVSVFFVYEVGTMYQGFVASILMSLSLIMFCVLCGAAIEDYNTRVEKPNTEENYLAGKDSKLGKPIVGLSTDSEIWPISDGQTLPVEVIADLSASSKTGISAAQTRDLVDAALAKFNEGLTSESLILIEEAAQYSPSHPVLWSALTVIHIALNECEKAMIAKQRSMQIDKENPASILASALFDYRCLKSSEPELPEVLKVPSDGIMVEIESHQIPKSAKVWWEEGLRQLKKGDPQIALRMFHAALIEFQHFPQAWEGVAMVYVLMYDEAREESALIGKELSVKKENIPEEIWEAIQLTPKSQWVERITLCKLVYGTRFRLSVL